MKKLFKRGIAASVATGAVISGSAFAALPSEATAALTTAQTDVVELGGLALAVIIAAMAFKYMRRAL